MEVERGGGKDKVYMGAKCVAVRSGRGGTLSMSCRNTFIRTLVYMSNTERQGQQHRSKLTDCVRLTLSDSLLG